MSNLQNPELLKLSKNAMTVLTKRYLKRDVDGNPLETPVDMFRRVAKTINDAEPKVKGKTVSYEDLYFNMMTDLDFPQLSDLDECRARTGPALCLFRFADPRFDGKHFRSD